MDNTSGICESVFNIIKNVFWRFYPFHTAEEKCACKCKYC